MLTLSTTHRSYPPGWTLLFPHQGVPLAVPFRFNSPFPGPSIWGLEVPEVTAGSLMEAALMGGSKRGCPPGRAHRVMRSFGAMRCWGKLVEKGLMKAQLTPMPRQPNYSIRKALNIHETIQTSQVGMRAKH